MAKPLPPDLRLRIVRSVEDEGMSCRGAAGRFGVAPSTAIELVSEWHRKCGISRHSILGII
jgi:transposase